MYIIVHNSMCCMLCVMCYVLNVICCNVLYAHMCYVYIGVMCKCVMHICVIDKGMHISRMYVTVPLYSTPYSTYCKLCNYNCVPR
jgi:hypothetical protein